MQHKNSNSGYSNEEDFYHSTTFAMDRWEEADEEDRDRQLFQLLKTTYPTPFSQDN